MEVSAINLSTLEADAGRSLRDGIQSVLKCEFQASQGYIVNIPVSKTTKPQQNRLS